jgi:hypothetical protein
MKLMRRVIDLERIRTVIEDALSVSVQGIHLPGIVHAAVKNVALSAKQLQWVAAELEKHGRGDIRLSAEVELFLRISNTDVLRSLECAEFLSSVNANENDVRATVSNEKDWGIAWKRGMEPIKEAALQGMRSDLWNMDETLVDNSYTFAAAMILLASELVGPYFERLATFVGYPPALVQVIGSRLQEAKIWESDEVHSEEWFDPKKGAIAFMLDLSVAEGKMMRRWSQERKQYVYRGTEIMAVSHFAV